MDRKAMQNSKKLTYVINNAAFFVSHRLPLAMAARQRGFDPDLVTGLAGSATLEQEAVARLATEQLPHRRVQFAASSINPVGELRGLASLVIALRRTSPELVHCASPKGNMYGGIAARLANVPALVLAVSGQGYIATAGRSDTLQRTVLARIGNIMARLAFAHPNKRVIVQNLDDRKAIISGGLAHEREVRIIPGSGVDLSKFHFVPQASKKRQIVLPARMLFDKGINEFVAAARVLRSQFPDWRFILAGTADYDNPSAVSQRKIKTWEDEGVIEWLGHVDDMPKLLGASAIVCLPSYREGMPKSLLEAAATGAAVVTTDTVGCRESIEPGRTGLLVKPHDHLALVDALADLMRDEEKRDEFGKAGRILVEQRFSLESVIEQTMAIYAELSTHQ